MARKDAYEQMDDLQYQVEHTLTRQMMWDQPLTHDATQYAGENHVWNPLNTAYPEWQIARSEERNGRWEDKS